MNNNDRQNLYNILDDNEELSDSEKREEYFAEIENQEEQERWEAQ